MKNSLRIHKWTHNEFNIFILGVLTHPLKEMFIISFLKKTHLMIMNGELVTLSFTDITQNTLCCQEIHNISFQILFHQ